MQTEPIPTDCCQCGCGTKTPIAGRTRRGHRKGEPLAYILGHNSRVDAPRKPQFPVVDGKKVCAECREAKPVEEFPVKRERGGSRLGTLCRPCTVQYKRWRHLEKSWGFSREEWEAIFDAQGRVCAICGIASPARGWHVDHDHSCCMDWQHCGKCVRGILCHRCNTGLGFFDDSAEALQRAQQYLEAARRE